ncbi:MAG: hypothetical protein KDB14_23500 [Planctomycetales bacterium]|nr:hypothetical protein [Planctomycetales bacterium]
MRTYSIAAALVTVLCTTTCFPIQQCNAMTEEQLTAELIWAYVNSMEYGEKVQTAADRLRMEFPESATAALWQGIIRSMDSEQTDVIDLISKTISDLSPQLASETQLRRELVEITQRLERKAGKSQKNSRAKADLEFLRASQLDKRCLAAWAALLESDDVDLAIRAADEWARVDTKNSLPLYARAGLIQRLLREGVELTDRERKKLSHGVTNALRQGNERPHCTVPSLPFPRNFEIEFDSKWEEEVPGVSGKSVTYGFLRRTFDRLNERFSWQGRSPISVQEFRRLSDDCMRSTRQLSEEDQVARLHELLRVELHFSRSNSFMHAISSTRPRRLQVLAANQGDFDAVERYHDIGEHLAETRRQISRSYKESTTADDGEDARDHFTRMLNDKYFDVDQDAAKIMGARDPAPEIPRVRFRDPASASLPQFAAGEVANQKIPTNTTASTSLLHAAGVDYVRLDAYSDLDSGIVVNSSSVIDNAVGFRMDKYREDGKLYIADLTEEEIRGVTYRESGLRISYLYEQLSLLFALNRTARRNVGAYVVLHGQLANEELIGIAKDCGLVSKRDRLIIGSRNESHLNALYEEHGPRLAWIVDAKKLISLSPAALGDLLEVSKRRMDAIALDLRESKPDANELARVVRAIKSDGLAVHLIEGSGKVVRMPVRAEVDVIVTSNLDADVIGH